MDRACRSSNPGNQIAKYMTCGNPFVINLENNGNSSTAECLHRPVLKVDKKLNDISFRSKNEEVS